MALLDDELLGRLGHLNYMEFSRELTRETGPTGEILEHDGLLLFAGGSPFPVLLNGVWRLHPEVPAPEVVARADEWFAARGRGYSLNVRDGWAEDDDLRAAATEAGLVSLLNAPEMVRRTPVDDRVLLPGCELRWVEDRSTFDDFINISDLAYSTIGMPAGTIPEAVTQLEALLAPHVHSVVAYLEGEPVAAAQTVLSHGIAGVYWVGTVEAARGKGLGDAVTRAVTNRAFDDGARANTLQASSMGEPIYLRMGYETLYRYSTLVRFEPTTT